jgi:hypothetical protein
MNGERRPYANQLVWAGVIGMAYLPGTIAPVGRTPDGLPVGMQIVGPYCEDRTPIERRATPRRPDRRLRAAPGILSALRDAPVRDGTGLFCGHAGVSSAWTSRSIRVT